jgi:putative hydrolase of the HAD superfamily
MTGEATAAAKAEAGHGDLTRFRNIRSWIFDLDNTLYPSHLDIFPQVHSRIRDYVHQRLGLPLDEAERVQNEYYDRYGTTLRGLILHYGVEPDEFLEYVHDINHSQLAPAPLLAERIGKLPGRRFILTNGSRRHAEKVAEKLGFSNHFEDIFDIVWAGQLPKPSPETYDRLVRQTGIAPQTTAMFEDLARNLIVPKKLGMITVLVAPQGTRKILEEGWNGRGYGAEDVDFISDDLVSFLDGVLTAVGARPDA